MTAPVLYLTQRSPNFKANNIPSYSLGVNLNNFNNGVIKNNCVHMYMLGGNASRGGASQTTVEAAPASN